MKEKKHDKVGKCDIVSWEKKVSVISPTDEVSFIFVLSYSEETYRKIKIISKAIINFLTI